MATANKTDLHRCVAPVALILLLAAAASAQPVITVPPLPGGEVTAPYPQEQFTATDTDITAICCTFAVSSGTLPGGLTLSSAGLLSGTPTAAGSFGFRVTATDTNGGTSKTTGLTISIVAGPGINETSLPSGVEGVAYSATLTASNGTPGYSWSQTGAPTNITIDPNTGSFSGTPTVAGTFPITVTVTDSVGGTGSRTYNLAISVPPPVVTTASVPQGEATAPYPPTTLVVTGGTGPAYTWSLSGGSLPTGISLSPGGVISGTTSQTGSFLFSVQVTDNAMVTSASQSLTLTIIAGPSITTGSPLPQGEAGAAYSQTLSASGGSNTGFVWSLANASLPPPGLSLSAGGVISGMPTTPGPFNFTVQVTDSAGGSGTQPFALTIITGPTITTAPSLPNGTVNVVYADVTLAASGGTPSYTWSITAGSLPAGLSLNGGTGTISGTPTASGTLNFTVQVTDAKGVTATKQFTITITAGLTIVTAPTLPSGSLNISYSQVLGASGGTPPYAWAITSGALPSGITLDAQTGAIAGTPTVSGAFSFTVQVTDSASVTASKQFTLNIAQSLVITTPPTLPGGSAGTAYSVTLGASGGTPSYTWSITAGALPPGLSLNASTGAISGVPTAAGTFGFTVRVIDSASASTSKAFSLSIIPGLAIITGSTLPSGSVGAAYSVTLRATGGTPPYAWALATGALPAGLTISSSSASITGTPSSAGTFTFTIQVSDNSLLTTSQQFTLTIVTGLVVATASPLPSGAVSSAYSAALTATGGTPPYRWVVSGALPAGVALNSTTGVISGTPSNSGVFTFTAQVTDNAGATASKQFSLSINAGLSIATGAALPAGTLGQAYALVLAAIGGSQPYKWSVTAGAVAPGLALNSANGAITGTPSAAGTFTFTVQVADSSGATASQRFTLSVSPPGLPQVNISGLPDSPQPAQQITFNIALTSGYPLDITGQITLSFQPDAVNPADDPTIQFSTGGRTANFTIPANSTTPVPIGLQTGTVAGTIKLSFALEAGGAAIPASGLDRTISIPRSAPVVQKVSMTTNSTGLQIQVLAFSTPRELTEADVHFTAAAGANLQTTDVTISLASVGNPWFQSTQSAQFGGQVLLLLPFTASQGSVSAVGSVSVVLKNPQGASQTVSASF